VTEASLDVQLIGITVDERRQVIIAHGTQIAVDPPSEQVDQANRLEVSQYGSL
jgi:hypothetical protein